MLRHLLNNWGFSDPVTEPGEGGGGGAPDPAPAPEPGVDPNQPAPEGGGTPEGPEGFDPNVPPTPEDPMIPLSVLQQLPQFQQQQQQPAPQPLTQEQIDQTLRRFNPNEEFVANFFGVGPEGELNPQQVAAVNQLVEGLRAEYTTALQHMTQWTREDLSQQFAPALQGYQQNAQQAWTSTITQQHPALAGHEHVIDNAIALMKAEGYVPHNTGNPAVDEQRAAYDTAMRAARLIQLGNPQFNLNGQAPQSQTPAPPAGMAPMGGGSQGGAEGATHSSNGGDSQPNWLKMIKSAKSWPKPQN